MESFTLIDAETLDSVGKDDRNLLPSFPQSVVTSNLDPGIQRADHRQGGGGICRIREQGPNSFVLKILTSKSQWLKILQSIFANTSPVKAFRGMGGGGVPHSTRDFPGMKLTRERPLRALIQEFFQEIFTVESISAVA
jgi:hypothetical protein